MKIDLGCGMNKASDHLGLDRKDFGIKGNSKPYVDVIHDLEESVLPFTANTIDGIRSYHVFEHIRNFIPLMNECWRILKEDGELNLTVPVGVSEFFLRDPTHVRPFTGQTFEYFTFGHKRFDRHAAGYDILPWDVVSKKIDSNELTMVLKPHK